MIDVTLNETEFDVGDEPITIAQVVLSYNGVEVYLDPDQVVDLMNQLEYFHTEMVGK